jgi:ABC-2 type transport system ATP-binding protein
MTRPRRRGKKRALIAVSHLTKRFGAQVAVDDISFEIGKGEVVGFLGPNGAGKSTTLRILVGFLGPTSGEVTIAGHDIVDECDEARRAIGYMPEAVPLYPEMRVIEYLRFRAELKGVPGRQRADRVDAAMRKGGVLDVANRPIGTLSKGYRQRVGLADAVVANPPIVVLDEPTAGLDPNQIREARELVRDLGRDHTVVVSTHILGEVEACATRVLLLHRGKLVAAGPTSQIRASRAAIGVEMVIGQGAEAAEALARSVPGIATVRASTSASAPGFVSASASTDGEKEAGRPTLRLQMDFAPELREDERARATERCVAALVAGGCGVREVRPAGGSLEEVFAALTRSDQRVAEAG